MKKLLFWSVATILFSCSSNEPEFISNSERDLSNDPNKRSVTEAIEIANQCRGFNSKNIGRSSSKIVNETSVSYLTRPNGRSNNDTLIYAIDYQDDEGYILISANKNTEPVLAIVEKGSFSDKDTLTCGYDFFIEQALNYVATAPSATPISSDNKDFILEYKCDTLKMQEANPSYRLEVEWGQYWPENMFIPNKIAGSAPIATAQLFSYFEPDYFIQLNFENKPFDELTINWSLLKKHAKSTGYSAPNKTQLIIHGVGCEANDQIHLELGCLVRCLADSHTTGYMQNEQDETYTPWSFSILNSFDFASKVLQNREQISMIPGQFYETLKSDGIGVVAANTDEDWYKHSWLADGTTQIQYFITTYYNYNTRTKEYTHKTEEQQTLNYIHYNWGMHGRYNGWFLDGVFDLEKGENLGFANKSRANFEVKDIIVAYVFK